jgi:hypothetical protein
VRLRALTGRELRQRIDDGWRPWLVHIGPAHAFARAHLPGAIWVAGLDQLLPLLEAGDPVVLYGAGEADDLPRGWRPQLLAHATGPLWHYRGGLTEWREAGAPLEP